MPPTIDIIRHAESRHNVEPHGNTIRDPHLTANGVSQAKTLRGAFPYMSRVKRIISSPMRRTVQTALLGFSPILQEGTMEVVLLPELQESSARPSDMGSPAPELRAEFGHAVDLGFLFDGWWYKDATETYGKREQAKVAERVRRARVYIRSVARTLGDDDHLVVVAHRGSIKNLIPGVPKFRNAEMRSCRFVDLFADDDQAILAEVIAE
ncbi:histidine phosphatase superfamily [Xylaria sp. FL1042]|nr:histidine phosphatase superfamily [Xylaria sp. FL1042]